MSGHYTTTQASRMTGAPKGTAIKFIRDMKGTPGPWPGENQMIRGKYCLSFQDLMELRKIAEMLHQGCTLKEIRKRAEETGREYPLSTRGESSEMAEDPSVTLDHGRPVRWMPGIQWDHPVIGDLVMLDPRYNYGDPSTRESCLRTELLLDRYHAEGNDLAAVAQDYRIDIRDIRAAVAFERALARGPVPANAGN